MPSFERSLTCGIYKAAVTKRINACEKMGTGWSQDEGSQSQPSEGAKHIERKNSEKKITETPLSEAKPNIERKNSEKKTTETLLSEAKPNIERKTSEKKTTETLLSEAKPKTVVLGKAADAKGYDLKGNASAAQSMKLPHNYEAVIRDADSSLIDGISANQLHGQLCSTGVFLNNKTKKYWVDKTSNSNCFMLYARDLSITWGGDNRYWNWQHRNETSDVYVDVAELLNVCWLEVHGKFNTRVLSPGILYEVVFVVMVNADAYGWEVPVNLRLTLPNGNKQEHKENLMTKPRGRWIEVPVGEFKASPENDGMLEFELYEYKGGQWKHGLVIKGVVIRPKN